MLVMCLRFYLLQKRTLDRLALYGRKAILRKKSLLGNGWKLKYGDLRMFGCQSENRFIFTLMKCKHPVYIMVFGVVTSGGDIMSQFIFLHGLRLNMEAYIKCLEEVVLTRIKKVPMIIRFSESMSPNWRIMKRVRKEWQDSTSSHRALRHATLVREPNVGCE